MAGTYLLSRKKKHPIEVNFTKFFEPMQALKSDILNKRSVFTHTENSKILVTYGKDIVFPFA